MKKDLQSTISLCIAVKEDGEISSLISDIHVYSTYELSNRKFNFRQSAVLLVTSLLHFEH